MDAKTIKLDNELLALMEKYILLGAKDTEPRYWYQCVVSAGEHGEPFPLTAKHDNQWELYSSVRGYQAANRALTNKAKQLWKALLEEHLGVSIK